MDVPHRRRAAGGDACRKTMTAFRARLDELVRAGQLTREECLGKKPQSGFAPRFRRRIAIRPSTRAVGESGPAGHVDYSSPYRGGVLWSRAAPAVGHDFLLPKTTFVGRSPPSVCCSSPSDLVPVPGFRRHCYLSWIGLATWPRHLV